MVFSDPNMFNYGLGMAALGAGRLMSQYKKGLPMSTAAARRNHYVGGGVSRKRVARRRKTFAARVRNLAPYKHNTINDNSFNPTLTHNTIYTTNITAQITQGDSITGRDGDAVILTSLKCKGAIQTAAATGAFMYRIIVCWSGEEYDLIGSSAGLSAGELFLGSQGGSFNCNSNCNPKSVTVLYDEHISINSLIATTSDVQQIFFSVPINQKFSYQSSGSRFGKMKNLYVVVIPSVVGGTSGVTSCGQVFFNTDMVFQNS